MPVKRRKTKRKTNPRGKHLAGATAAEQRQYERIKASELKRGAPLADAKRIAAATVRKRAKNHGKRRNPLSAAAEKLANELGISAGERSILGAKSPAVQMKFLRREKAKQKLAARKAAKAAKAQAAAQAQAKAARPKRGFVSRLGTRLKVIGQTKKVKVQARDLGRCKRRVVKVRARHDSDALAKAASKLGSGFDQLKVINRTAKRKNCNPTYTVEAIPKYTSTVKEEVKALTRGSAIRKLKGKVQGPKDAYRWRVEKNPTRKGMRGKYASTARARREYEKRYGSEYAKKYELELRKRQRRVSHGAKRRNPTPAEIRKEFAGSVGPGQDLYFPSNTPHGLAKLGKLVAIETEEGTIKPVAGAAWLCADKHGRFHIGSVSGADIYSGPRRDFGKVKEIEYETAKPHLGYGPTIWTHKMGEGGGVRPTLHSDGQGGLIFKGGSYQVKREGIVG